ncbi:hypothetical protein TNCV_4481321 [Trichonephila clavipes]|nr:hypothetical protein TNCV_4481321 [Trichonephila clavipes]
MQLTKIYRSKHYAALAEEELNIW